MKLETLARRLAEKTNTPELEDVILGQSNIDTLPMTCMEWTGAAFGVSPRKDFRKSRSSARGWQVDLVKDKPYGVMQWQGKVIAVRRLIFQLINKPDFPFRMWNTCGSTLCVNPFHYSITSVEPAEETIVEIEDGDAFPYEEALEIVEAVLTGHDLENFRENPMLEDIPEDLLREVLTDLNKEHLL